MNYTALPHDCRSNNFLENYNGYIKQQLGKRRIVNWVNFMDFIKKESSRSIEKLLYGGKDSGSQIKEINFNHTLLMNINKEYKNEEKMEIEYFDDEKSKSNIENPLNKSFDKDELINNLVLTKLGMKNLGETCYMNCAIQILIHLRKFLEKIMNLKEKKQK